ncbi:CBS domain-containing protein [Aliiroseovarius sp. S1339]|uniref:CBS domain-containing protein n=1 Tax=Aliiroseovarius sp. S1339 TaxID=2936990 RepID=UPI0020BD55F0|nr:CBS domain-containing protein [Aliiroseovarius sp. S1339]MCK8462477.1 CBS domain-containing protein [Aliiroseovarius sp. S1339]
MAEERISSVMQTDFLRLSGDCPIREATARLVEGASSGAAVVDEAGQLIGIITEKDCFRPALNASYYQQWSGTVADSMNTDITTIEAETDFVTAAEVFLDQPFRSFPVMRNGELVGMLDRADLLKVFLRHG